MLERIFTLKSNLVLDYVPEQLLGN